MDISVLPQELVELVAGYLSLNDILSCCLVNSTWRHVFNDNKIWFNLCSKRSPVHFDKFSFIQDSCSVVPRFEFLNQKCGILEPVCKWRERFMQEAHLTRNWRHGRHSKHMIIDYIEDGRDKYKYRNIQGEGDFILVPYSKRLEFYVYNIHEDPVRTQIINYTLDYVAEEFFRFAQYKLVIVQCTLLQIYRVSPINNCIYLANVFLFDRPQKDSEDIPLSHTSSWYESNIGLYPCDIFISCDFNGQYFVGAVCDKRTSYFHIWDIENSCKIGIKYLPPRNLSVLRMYFRIFKSYLFIFVTYYPLNETTQSVYRFDFTTLEFSPVLIELSYSVPYVRFSDKYIIKVDRELTSLFFWNHNNDILECTIPCNNLLNLYSLEVTNNHLVYAENTELTSTVHVIPLNDLNHVSEMQVPFIVRSVRMVRDGMMLVTVQMGLLLLDLSTSSILTVLEYNDWLWSNPSRSKVVTKDRDGLYLLYFW